MRNTKTHRLPTLGLKCVCVHVRGCVLKASVEWRHWYSPRGVAEREIEERTLRGKSESLEKSLHSDFGREKKEHSELFAVV